MGSSGIASCSLSGNCNGHVYQVTCSSADMSVWDCYCSVDGSNTMMFLDPSTTVCSINTMMLHWTSQCHFP
jgi:hypothetical protein